MSNARGYPESVIDIAERILKRDALKNKTVVAPVNPDDEKQVYGCGKCKDQGHRLVEDYEIVCGQCTTLSEFLWYVPQKKVVDFKKREPRMKTSVVDKLVNYVCRRCGHNRFHLHQSGTLTCYRCRHAASWKWWLPEKEPLVG